MKKTWRRSVATLVTALGLTVGMAVAIPTVADAAVTCSGKDCNGKDPEKSGCAAAKGTRTLRHWSNEGGVYIELRYSPRCRTSWVRATMPRSVDPYETASRYVWLEITRRHVDTPVYRRYWAYYGDLKAGQRTWTKQWNIDTGRVRSCDGVPAYGWDYDGNRCNNAYYYRAKAKIRTRAASYRSHA